MLPAGSSMPYCFDLVSLRCLVPCCKKSTTPIKIFNLLWHIVHQNIYLQPERYRVMLNRSSIVLFLLLLSSVSFAQSGRRVAPTPKPTPIIQTNDEAPLFSESKPNPPRHAIYSNRFPGIGNGTGKPVFTPKAETPVTVEDDDVVTVDTNLITIPVSVFDRNGLYRGFYNRISKFLRMVRSRRSPILAHLISHLP